MNAVYMSYKRICAADLVLKTFTPVMVLVKSGIRDTVSTISFVSLLIPMSPPVLTILIVSVEDSGAATLETI